MEHSEDFPPLADTFIPPPWKTVSQLERIVIPAEVGHVGRDARFDGLTALSEVEGESRKIGENQMILDSGSLPAPRDLAGMTNCDADSRSGGGTNEKRGLESHGRTEKLSQHKRGGRASRCQ
jgi:hypothetical protein